MNTARDAILQRLKAPLKGIDRNIPAAEPATPPPPADRTQQLAQFIHCLEANHAQVITLRPPQVAATISANWRSAISISCCARPVTPIARR